MFRVIIPALAFLAVACAQGYGNLRFIHGIAGGPSFDIYADKIKILSGIQYGNITSYQKTLAKFYHVEARVAGSDKTVASTTFVISSGEYFTVSIGGSVNSTKSFSLIRNVDDFSAPPIGTTQLHFVHLSYNAGPVDVLVNGSTLFQGVAYGVSSDYIETNAAVYSVTVVALDTGKTIIGPLVYNFASEKDFSVIAIGNVGSNDDYPVQGVITLDGSFSE
eukprot:TRINITY_DN31092_c0_g1_i1.p1 TRINITY_DN31092_c0_g1~~TRINITY_DN31092_c0_g1_i1.p1  ORF type:complete len:220 (+),score=88.36 TRINITY_DN31092_c0_g1_i1:106-765(+)